MGGMPIQHVERAVGRAIEALWLLTAALVPLIFVPTDFMMSEAVNAYVEVPKTTAFRTLVGMMTVLWIVEWALKGGLSRKYTLAHFTTRIKGWVAEQPSRWVVVAAVIYVWVAIISTFLSTSFWISVWGEVSGQFGYSAYTTVSYFLLFAVIATHLKTRDQLWRLLGVLVVMGGLAALYGVIQHYDMDPLDLGETGSARVTITMANPVFSGAVMVVTTLLISGVALAVLDRMGWVPMRVAMWVGLMASQVMVVYWTGSRGSWLLGVPAGLLVLLITPVLIDSLAAWVKHRAAPWHLLGLLASLFLLTSLVVSSQLVVIGIERPLELLRVSGLPLVRMLLGFVGLMGFVSLLILVAPGQLDATVRAFAKTFLLVVSALLLAILVIALTGLPTGGEGLEFRDFSGLPDSDVLIGLLVGAGLVSLLVWSIGGTRRSVARAFLVLSSAVFVIFLTSALRPALPAGSVDQEGSSAVAGVQEEVSSVFAGAQEEVSSLESASVARGLSYRTDIWKATIDLSIHRTWFEYEDLSLPFIRPLVGYGPEMFKYTFPLESPLGGLLSQAHNFFLHHWIEQGLLGLFSSVGIFIAFFVVGLAQLWRNRDRYSTTHKWILVALLATIGGKVAEMMVGVARESDLVLVWILLAVFVVLPSVMSRSEEAEGVPATEGPARPLTRRERRSNRPGGRERRAQRSGGGGFGAVQLIGIVAVSALVIFIGWLTWVKNVEYAWAATVAASAREEFNHGRIQAGQKLMLEARGKAPDVPIYYHNVAGIYDSYRDAAINNPQLLPKNPGGNPPECHEVFALDPSAQPTSSKPYARCAEEAYLNNQEGFRRNRYSPQAKLLAANSALELASIDGQVYQDKAEEAVQLYQELTAMIPSSWPLHNALATAYLRLDRPEAALEPLEKSLAISRGSQGSGQAFYLMGLVHRELGNSEKVTDFFELSLWVDAEGPSSGRARSQLVGIYNAEVVESLQQDQPQEALQHVERFLAVTRSPSESAAAFYLQGVAYQQLEEPDQALDSFMRSLEADESGPFAAEAHTQLADVYTKLDDPAQAEVHSRLAGELNQPAPSDEGAPPPGG